MSKRVLLVEDHDELRQVMGSFLSKDFEVTGVSNGVAAMMQLKRGNIPDVIVTDTNMPEMSGAELLQSLRCSGLYADVPIIVVNEPRQSGDEASLYLSLGASAYFEKPLNPMHLMERLSTLVK